MRAPEILLTTTLLAEGCCLPLPGEQKAPEEKPSVELNELNSRVKGYNTMFELPNQVDALEAEAARKVSNALTDLYACKGPFFYRSDEGAFRELNVSDRRDMVFLSDKEQCVGHDGSGMCTSVALQYSNGEMVNGFTVMGVCLPPEAKDFSLEKKTTIARESGFAPEVDLSARLSERTVYKQ